MRWDSGDDRFTTEAFLMLDINANNSVKRCAIVQTAAYNDLGGLIRAGDVTLTADEMKIIGEHCTHEIQNTVRNLETAEAKNHIDVLATLMRREQWLDRSQMDFGILKGHPWRVNGNHSGKAQEKTGKTLTWNIRLHHVVDEQDLRKLFHKFDTNVRLRTSTQIVKAVSFAEENALTKTAASKLYTAAMVIEQKFTVKAKGKIRINQRIPDYRLDLAQKWAAEAGKYDTIVKNADRPLKKKLLNAGTMAVALVTLKYQGQDAIDFWTAVADDDGLRKADPRKALVDVFRSRNMVGSLMDTMTYPAAAWNAWYEGRTLRSLRASDTVSINGTPYERGTK